MAKTDDGNCRISSRRRRYRVGKMAISAVTMAETLDTLVSQARNGRSAYVCAANVEAAVLAQRDADFCAIENQSLLTLPDGMPLVWCARLIGESAVERVTGPDVMIETLRRSSEFGLSHYFYGDTDETLHKLSEIVRTRYPGAVVKGVCSPPFRPLRDEEVTATIAEINRLQPSFVWVALGCPKQERWVAQVLPHIDSAVLVAVGAAFRFILGEYRHPPKILQVCGLEGIFWRFWRHPVPYVKWLCYHVPALALLMIGALARRISRCFLSRPCG